MNLSGYSDALTQLVARAAPAVVSVAGARTVSGTVIAPGQVVTVAHVLPDDDPTVTDADGAARAAQVLGRDPLTDLALLQVPDLTAQAPPPAPGRLGELLVAVARPDARRVQVSAGVVADLGDPQGGGWWRSDARPFPGCSGGLAVGAGGGWLGVLNAGAQRGQLSVLPAPLVLQVAQQLAALGRVPRGFLGVQTHPVRLPAGHAARWGLAVTATEAGSPADGVLLPGDLLVALEGEPLTSVSALLAHVRQRPGQPTHLTILRAGREHALTLVPQAR